MRCPPRQRAWQTACLRAWPCPWQRAMPDASASRQAANRPHRAGKCDSWPARAGGTEQRRTGPPSGGLCVFKRRSSGRLARLRARLRGWKLTLERSRLQASYCPGSTRTGSGSFPEASGTAAWQTLKGRSGEASPDGRWLTYAELADIRGIGDAPDPSTSSRKNEGEIGWNTGSLLGLLSEQSPAGWRVRS